MGAAIGMMAGPGFGYATFCTIKFVGYTAAAHVLPKQYEGAGYDAWKIGAVRTRIGMVAGGLYVGLWLLIDAHFARRRSTNCRIRTWRDWGRSVSASGGF
jgi:hypothetical protein